MLSSGIYKNNSNNNNNLLMIAYNVCCRTEQPCSGGSGLVEVRVSTMAVDGISSALAIRSSVGIEVWASSGPRQPYEHKEYLPQELTKNSRSVSFSPDGRYFAYTNGQEIKVFKTSDWLLQCSMPRPKAFYLKFSPRGNYLCVWELYVITKDKPEGAPNMFVYELVTGAEVLAIVQKKQTDWEPSWSSDETLFALVVGGEAHFYDLAEGAKGFATIARKIGGNRGGILSVGPGHCPPYLAMYAPGTKGGPSMCKLYKYPVLEQNQAVACKSFFQADRVEMLWNKRGTGLLLLTSTEVDKSGASYYGNQAVHFMSTKDDSCSVPLSKKGPVHCVKWSPKATEFIVVYGFMPSKAALYNLKCDVIFDFEKGPHNCAYFNPFGNLVVLAGFGNLPGNVEIWDLDKREKLANIRCPDTTHFEWNPNGEYFVTATTAPRLRIGNGFKVYHYSGALMHETIWPTGQELLGVEWQLFPDQTFSAPVITKAKQEGIKSSQPEASKNIYTPPHLRLKMEGKNPEEYIPQPQPAMLAGQQSIGGQVSKSSNYKNNNMNHKFKNGLNKMGNNYSSSNNNHQISHYNNTNNNSNNNNSINNAAGTGNQKDKNHYNKQHNTNNSGINNNNNINSSFFNKKKQHPPLREKLLQDWVVHDSPHSATSNDSVCVQKLTEPKQERRQRRIRPAKTSKTSKSTLMSDKTQQQDGNADIIGQQKDDDHKASGCSSSGEKEMEKKIRTVAKKLSDIKKLKQRREKGEILELNQLNKISNESRFLEELKSLKNTQTMLDIGLRPIH